MRIVRCLFLLYLKKEKILLNAFFAVSIACAAARALLTTVGFWYNVYKTLPVLIPSVTKFLVCAYDL